MSEGDEKTLLYIEFDNGETWKINARIIAEQRAEYYANKDCEKGTEEHQEMLEEEEEYALNTLSVLRDWALNNMNWSTIQRHGEKVEEPSFNPEEAWRKGTPEMELKQE